MIELIFILLLMLFAILTTTKPHSLSIGICPQSHAHRALSVTVSWRGNKNSLPAVFLTDTVAILINQQNLRPLTNNPGITLLSNPSDTLPSNPGVILLDNPDNSTSNLSVFLLSKSRARLSSNLSRDLLLTPSSNPSDSPPGDESNDPPLCSPRKIHSSTPGDSPISQSVLPSSNPHERLSNNPS
jgi:hypothetical protein